MLGQMAVFASAGANLAHAGKPNYEAMWADFKDTFQKSYGLGADQDEGKRFEIFKTNVDIIEDVNSKNLSYMLGINQFADMTADEVASQYTGLKKPDKVWGDLPYLGRDTYSGNELAAAVDWSTKGAVTPVKNQGQCGSCWSFSTTGSLEGAWEIATGKLVSLSEQQFVDCDKVDQACNGGLMDNAFKFAEKNALCTEASYAYKGTKGTCAASSCSVGIPKGGIVGFKDVSADDENALMEAITKNPVSIAIEADKPSFQMYKTGVLTKLCGTTLDHGVLAVGYGTEGSQKYWKVKNSWGATWGENGYIRLAKGGKKTHKGECGILSGPPSYPVVNSKPGPSPPAPPAPPSPPAPPPAPTGSHYEKPPCQEDEMDARIQGIDGEVCTPKCKAGVCPTDVPAGTTATPQCILSSPTGDKYCALTCESSGCPTGAKCEAIGATGICMYPSDASRKKVVLGVSAAEMITVV
jgi:hypothetical protein